MRTSLTTSRFVDYIDNCIFTTPITHSSYRLAHVIVLSLLLLLGYLHWIFFFNFGSISFTAYDWDKEYAYLTVLHESITSQQIPLHINMAFQDTKRFLAIPETLLSPQILLLPFMTYSMFVLVNTLLLYTVGFIGCFLILKQYL